MGTLLSGNPALQVLWLPVLLLQAQASTLLNSRPQTLLDLLPEDVEPCDGLDAEAKALTNQGQRRVGPLRAAEVPTALSSGRPSSN